MIATSQRSVMELPSMVARFVIGGPLMTRLPQV
jgi:hypothetical protein